MHQRFLIEQDAHRNINPTFSTANPAMSILHILLYSVANWTIKFNILSRQNSAFLLFVLQKLADSRRAHLSLYTGMISLGSCLLQQTMSSLRASTVVHSSLYLQCLSPQIIQSRLLVIIAERGGGWKEGRYLQSYNLVSQEIERLQELRVPKP